eukprot:TRINITY_DN1713_c0_g1_i2.p1 TRINITY_DN1713_c0_g1~~TRINITY_DN1713_c0_g1_i2.p1  ORF type:complete len:371 (+),score=68.63 TRINITY_DN1713_c0_g1_i2:83-1114(+)
MWGCKRRGRGFLRGYHRSLGVRDLEEPIHHQHILQTISQLAKTNSKGVWVDEKDKEVVYDIARDLYLLTKAYSKIPKNTEDPYWTPSPDQLLYHPEPIPPLLTQDPATARMYIKYNLTKLRFDPPEPFLQKMDHLLSLESSRTPPLPLAAIHSSALARRPGLLVWRGDICTLQVDAIVNAANDYMLGCFIPNHHCIDNVIHAKAGPRLRVECRQLMASQGFREPTGGAKITKGYHLPCRSVLHTVGPITKAGEVPRGDLLGSSYESCLEVASEHGLSSVAFCCISTGIFLFPNALAAEVAVDRVSSWLSSHPDTSIQTVIFNVFTDTDAQLYIQKLNRSQALP